MIIGDLKGEENGGFRKNLNQLNFVMISQGSSLIFFSLQFKLIIILWGLMYYISSFTPIFPSNCGHISSSVLKCSSRVSLRIDQRFMT